MALTTARPTWPIPLDPACYLFLPSSACRTDFSSGWLHEKCVWRRWNRRIQEMLRGTLSVFSISRFWRWRALHWDDQAGLSRILRSGKVSAWRQTKTIFTCSQSILPDFPKCYTVQSSALQTDLLTTRAHLPHLVWKRRSQGSCYKCYNVTRGVPSPFMRV